MDEVVTGIRILGGEVKADVIVKKVLISLPKASHNVSAIEESNELDKYLVDEMFGALTAFEMSEFDKDVPKKEVAFKVSRNIEDETVDQNDNFDEVEANFVRRLKKGIDKYKGKLPFKCINCGIIGLFPLNVLLNN